MRIHLTNITGLGASQLLQSLLPALESVTGFLIEYIDLPDSGILSKYKSFNPKTRVEIYQRWLPKILSRTLECTILGRQYNGNIPLIVFGDLPLRCRAHQTVFVQNSHLIRPKKITFRLIQLKYIVIRFLFRINLDFAQVYIVQTEIMKKRLEFSYPQLEGRVYIVPQPVPSWLLTSKLNRLGRVRPTFSNLDLIYPAAGYPHKNLHLLSNIAANTTWPVASLQLTVDPKINPAPSLDWIKCRGFLSPLKMVEAYSQVDGLLFLSNEESYGFPLIEAMFVGLPIVCPDLPYAHFLCGEQAIYFNHDSIDSLKNAIESLKNKLDKGWWPNWEEQMKFIPVDWKDVAKQILELAYI